MQVAPERPVEVRAVVHGVHLVHRHVVEIAGVGLDGVEQDDRLAVGQRQDEVGARAGCAPGRQRASSARARRAP